MEEGRHCPHVPWHESSSVSLGWTWQPMCPGATWVRLNRALSRQGQGGVGTRVLPPPLLPSFLESKCLSLFTLVAWLKTQRAITTGIGSSSENSGKGERSGARDRNPAQRTGCLWGGSCSEPWWTLFCRLPVASCSFEFLLSLDNAAKSLELMALRKPPSWQKRKRLT